MFGTGHRICPGIPHASLEIFIAVSRMLWVFEMMLSPGEPIDLRSIVVGWTESGLTWDPAEG